jgi:cytochrome c-type biogenesis protein CcmH/NrfG
LNDAERVFRAVIELDPGDVRATNDLAVALWQGGERQAAVMLLEDLVARAPEAEDAAWNLAEFRREWPPRAAALSARP